MRSWSCRKDDAMFVRNRVTHRQAACPSWPGGADRAPKKISRSILSKRGGVVDQAPKQGCFAVFFRRCNKESLWNLIHHPICATDVASHHFLIGADLPLLARRGTPTCDSFPASNPPLRSLV